MQTYSTQSSDVSTYPYLIRKMSFSQSLQDAFSFDTPDHCFQLRTLSSAWPARARAKELQRKPSRKIPWVFALKLCLSKRKNAIGWYMYIIYIYTHTYSCWRKTSCAHGCTWLHNVAQGCTRLHSYVLACKWSEDLNKTDTDLSSTATEKGFRRWSTIIVLFLNLNFSLAVHCLAAVSAEHRQEVLSLE